MEHIAAYSPEACGRSELAFRTFQDRLPKVSLLVGITTVAAANAYLRQTYVPEHDDRFAIRAEQDGTAFTPVSAADLVAVLCHQEERQVGKRQHRRAGPVRLQIPPSPLRAHYVRAMVKVRRYQDGSHAIFHGPRCIGRYDATGTAVAAELKQAA